MKIFGYGKVLEPLLKYLVTLEQEGAFAVSLGTNIKGTVHCVVADNLGAHSIGGLLSGLFVCRYCTLNPSQRSAVWGIFSQNKGGP